MTIKTYYISPATIPSRSANSIHVVNMCEALTQLDHEVTLFVRTERMNVEECRVVLKDIYGIESDRIEIIAYKSKMVRGTEFGIAAQAFLHFMKKVISGSPPDYIISRNPYSALLLGSILKRNIVYETHAPDEGIRKMMQKWLLRSRHVTSIVISNALCKLLSSFHGISENKLHVMPDAARIGPKPMNNTEKQYQRQKLLSTYVNLTTYKKVVGYFGHLYPGRGIEIIQGIASDNSSIAFIVFGGNEKEIADYRDDNNKSNLYFMGHLQPKEVRKAMAMMDVLLMPYQQSVSVGMDNVDTAQWMSPMKLFEYMSVGVPIISSDLPVLCEILEDQENCLMVASDDISSWNAAIKLLVDSPELATKISKKAYEQYLEKYTWAGRAQRMIDLLKI